MIYWFLKYIYIQQEQRKEQQMMEDVEEERKNKHNLYNTKISYEQKVRDDVKYE